MPITYRLDRTARLVEETWTGRVDKEDLKAYWLRFLADPEVLAIRRTLVDLRASTPVFTGDQLDDLVQTVVLPVLGDRDWQTAIVVDGPLQFGVSRQYQVFAERYSTDAIFNDIDKARTWLLGRANKK